MTHLVKCPDCGGNLTIHDVENDTEIDCPTCEGWGCIDGQEHLAKNQLILVREVLEADHDPFQTTLSAARSAVSRLEWMAEEIQRLSTLNAEMLTMLQQLEWRENTLSSRFCPVCSGWTSDEPIYRKELQGHESTCAFGNLIAKASQGVTP